MSNFVKLAAEASDKYIAALDQNQQGLLSYFVATRHWVMDAPTIPSPAVAPVSPQEIVASGFAFASSVLAQQKAFADKLLSLGTQPTRVRQAVAAKPKAKPAPAAKPAAVAKPGAEAVSTRSAGPRTAGAKTPASRVTSIKVKAKPVAAAAPAPAKAASKKTRRTKSTPSKK